MGLQLAKKCYFITQHNARRSHNIYNMNNPNNKQSKTKSKLGNNQTRNANNYFQLDSFKIPDRLELLF